MIHIRIISVLTKHQKPTIFDSQKDHKTILCSIYNPSLSHAEVHHTYLLTL